jgi:hypothetical protein
MEAAKKLKKNPFEVAKDGIEFLMDELQGDLRQINHTLTPSEKKPTDAAADQDSDDDLHFELAASTQKATLSRPAQRWNRKKALTMAEMVTIIERKKSVIPASIKG